jgi:hypothetical protein
MTQDPARSYTMRMKPRMLHQAAISFACTVIGWLAMIAYLFCTYLKFADVSPRWYAMPVTIGYVALIPILVVWLVAVLPVFCLVRPSSWFWRFPLPAFAFGALGLLIVAARTNFNYFGISGRMWVLATIVGFSTGAACSIFQRRLHRRLTQHAEQFAAPNGP